MASAPDARYSYEELIRALYAAMLDPAKVNRIEVMLKYLHERHGVELNPFDVIDHEKEAILSGRHQPPKRTSSIVACLCMWLKKAANEALSMDHGQKARFASLTIVKHEGEDYDRPIASDAPDPEQALIDAEGRRVRQVAARQLVGQFQGEPTVQRVIECMLDGVSKPRHIADRLQIPVAQVNAIQAKLRRRARSLLNTANVNETAAR